MTFIWMKMPNGQGNGTAHRPLLPFCVQQSTPDGDLEPEDHQQFKRLGSACLAEGASAQLRQFLEDEKNQVLVVHSGSLPLTRPQKYRCSSAEPSHPGRREVTGRRRC